MFEEWLALYVVPTLVSILWLIALRTLSGRLPVASVAVSALTNLVVTQFYRQEFASGLSWESGGAPEIRSIGPGTLLTDLVVFALVFLVGWLLSTKTVGVRSWGWIRPGLIAPLAAAAVGVHLCQALSPPLFSSWNALSLLGAIGEIGTLLALPVVVLVQLYDGVRVLRGGAPSTFGPTADQGDPDRR